MRTFANVDLDLTGQYPQMNLLRPNGYNLMPGPAPFADYRNYSNDSAMDHREDSDGTLNAARLDMEYEFGSDWLDDLSFGARFADREQEHKWSAYNWASISADWGTNPVDSWFLDSGPTRNPDGSIRFQGYEPGYYETRNFGSNILNGNLLTPGTFVFMRRDILRDPAATAARFSVTGQTDQGGVASSTWNPICDRPDELPDSCYTRGEILDVREKTLSGYAMLRFGGDNAELFSGIKVRGNLGVRVVETKLISQGALNFAQPFTPAQLNCVPLTPAEIAALPASAYAISISCLAAASVDDHNFSNGGNALSTASSSRVNVLPSFNLRLDLSDGFFVRFAASKAISKPDIGLLRNYVTMNRIFVPQSEIVRGNPNVVLNAAGQPVSYRYSYTASSGNPRLKPIRADQLDLSLEHYSSKFGTFGLALFYKKFHDYIQNGTFSVPITNNGVTRDVVVTGPVNGDGASIKGIELSYSGFFNFLPSPLDGFGVQANFTHLKNSGVTNSNLIIDTTGGNQVVASAILGNINPGVLEGLSDNSYNLVLLYEKERFGARLAYNWRSRFLTSVNDCCVGFPVWSRPQGFLDASLRYAITDNIEFSLQGSNLLRTKTRLMAQVEGSTALDPDRARRFLPTGYYESDRRVEAGIRVKF
jgi:iron complex outermembrane recepter protein